MKLIVSNPQHSIVSVSGFGVFVFIGAIGIASVVGAVAAAVIGVVDDSGVVGFKADGAKGSAAALLGDLRMIISNIYLLSGR